MKLSTINYFIKTSWDRLSKRERECARVGLSSGFCKLPDGDMLTVPNQVKKPWSEPVNTIQYRPVEAKYNVVIQISLIYIIDC